ncbi:aminopeptidase P family protein [Candidatus Peregrinibacteria bacterium]|nr:aminopeptidase P family protein [Candidatus Peregrinibacteria bacterium]
MLPDIILVTNGTNIRYFSGFDGSSGQLILFRKNNFGSGFLFTDGRYHLVANVSLKPGFKIIDVTASFEDAWKDFIKKYKVKNLGIEGNYMSVRRFKSFKKISRNIKIDDIGDELDKKRISKKSVEIDIIKRAQNIIDKVFAAIKKWLKPGQTENDIAWKIETLAHDFGADCLSFPSIVGINENSAAPHHHNTNKKLKRGDMILIDMGATHKGYCSDMTRVLFTKSPTGKQEKIYELVKKAHETAIAKLKSGVTGKNIDAVARDVIAKTGFGAYFSHSLGHGVGMDIHELPNLSQKYSGKIPAKSVVTIEPGIYLPGEFGVRLEDMVIVENNGVTNLTKTPKELKSAIIKI